ncbi:MAG: hypothetical protein ACRDUX_38845 [Mycobacterium sp.]
MTRMATVIPGVLHLLDRDLTSLCGCLYGFITGNAARCTCPSCLSIWSHRRDIDAGRPPVTGDAPTVSH